MIHILLVDDDPDILDILKMELEENPAWKIDTVTSAIEALQKVQSAKYEVIITDYIMPRMNGKEFLAAIRNQGLTASIILYSGRLDEEQEALMKDLGADAIIHRKGDPEVEFTALKNQIMTVEKTA